MEILTKEEDIQNHINHAISNDNLELEIIIGSKEGDVETITFKDLLPKAFTPSLFSLALLESFTA